MFIRNTPPESLKCCLETAEKFFDDKNKIENAKQGCREFYRNNVLKYSPFQECAGKYCKGEISKKEDNLWDMNQTYDQLYPSRMNTECIQKNRNKIFECVNQKCNGDHRCNNVSRELYDSFIR